VVCIHRRKGEVLWEYRTASHVESTPCLFKDAAGEPCGVIGAGDDGYYCFYLEPDGNGDARLKWKVPGPQNAGRKYPDAETSPAVADGKVFVGLGIGGNALVCLDAETGTERWRVDTPYPCFTPPSIEQPADGPMRVYIGMGVGDFVNSAEQLRAKRIAELQDAGASQTEIARAREELQPAGEVWCIDVEKAEMNPGEAVVWKQPVGRTVLGAVAIGKDGLYCAARGGLALKLAKADGRELAHRELRAAVCASPAVGRDHVYIATVSGRLYGLDADTLEVVLDLPLGGAEGNYSSPAIARGHVYAGSADAGLLCLGRPGQPEPPLWPAPLGGPGGTGRADETALPDRARQLWRWPAEMPDEPERRPSIVAAPAVMDGRLLVGQAAPDGGLLCFRIKGEEAAEIPAWTYQTAHGVFLSPLAMAHSALVVDGRPGDSGRKLHCVELAGGKARWAHPVDPEAGGHMLLLQDGIIVQSRAGKLSRLSHDGQVQWTTGIGGQLTGSPAAKGFVLLAATRKPDRLMAMDLPTGRLLWSVPLPEEPVGGPIPHGRLVLLGSPKGLIAYRLVNGARSASADTGCPSGPLVLAPGRVAYINTDNELILIDGRLETNPVRVGRVSGGVQPLLSADGVIVPVGRALVKYDHDGESSQRWLSTGLWGQLTSPILVVDGRLYAGTQRKGLVCAGGRR
jgi:outer membrane protein assembly factor BamB